MRRVKRIPRHKRLPANLRPRLRIPSLHDPLFCAQACAYFQFPLNAAILGRSRWPKKFPKPQNLSTMGVTRL